MPRAKRHVLPGQRWHITHGYREKVFLIRFARTVADPAGTKTGSSAHVAEAIQ
jgi:hypothetical protein